MIWNVIIAVVLTPIGVAIYRGGNKTLGAIDLGIGVLNAIFVLYKILV